MRPRLKLASNTEVFFALTLFNWYIVTYVSKVLIGFTFGLLESEDEANTIVET
jgi:hypothetical protein